ncbi:MAG TPA: TetR/AcrR family transcriptional regulator [Anaerolineae bacterium]|nr:TetR/AcrR family transcriptional regulator [Anaerolineae bacterium]HOQ99592.1 TetR/AcrR family transcriptional regulator [Anaerolineae bacterium]HPL30390.1 TetR/AcrR family transcriptional regulator [Anaerolineae bacterium]
MKQQQRSEETRAHILAAAQACFAAYGYEAAGVATICARAGVSKGAFYHHFPTKQALFLELLNRWLADLDAEMARIRGGAGTVPEALLGIAGVAGHIFEAGRGQLPLFLEFWTQAAYDPEIWQATIEPYRRFRSYFAALIQAGIDEGSLAPVDPTLAAQVFFSLATGLVVQGMLDPEGADWARVAREGVERFLRAFARDGGRLATDERR